MPPPDLAALVADELAIPVDPRVARLAAAIAARHRTVARAVLFYGSCLRESALDGLMLDFYLIVSDYGRAYRTRWEAIVNRLLPPNVYPFEADGLVAKYAVLSVADFHRLCGPETDNPSVWARFAQPSRLVWAADEAARASAIAAIARAAPTLLSRVDDQGAGPELDRWRRAFALTYAAELRAERSGRAASVVDADPDRYRRFTGPALAIARGYPPRGGPGARLAADAAARQAAHARAARQGIGDLRGRARLSRVEDQSPRAHRHRDPAVAAALADPRRAQSAAPPACARRGALSGSAAKASATARSSAAKVKGFLSIASPASSPASSRA